MNGGKARVSKKLGNVSRNNKHFAFAPCDTVTTLIIWNQLNHNQSWRGSGYKFRSEL